MYISYYIYLAIYLINCDSCYFETNSIVLDVNVSRTLSFLCNQEIKDIKFDLKFDGTIKIIEKNKIELSISSLLIKTTYKILINNLYESSLEISNSKEKKLPRSFLTSQSQGEVIKKRYLDDKFTFPPTNQIDLELFNQIILSDGIDRDYFISDIKVEELRKWNRRFVAYNYFDGHGYTFTFTFLPNQIIDLQIFDAILDGKIANVGFIIDLSFCVINNTGIFRYVQNSIFYNVNITIKNNNGIEITYAKGKEISGLFANELDSTSLLHVGVFIEDNLNILFKLSNETSNEIGDVYYGLITGYFKNDSKTVGAGGLFIQTHDIFINTTELKNMKVHFGGLIGKSEVELSDSVALFNNVKIEEVNFGGLIGDCFACQVSTSFAEITNIDIKGTDLNVGGLVSRTVDSLSSYSILDYCYFKLNSDFSMKENGRLNIFGGIIGKTNKVRMNTIVVEITTATFKSGKGNCSYLIGDKLGAVYITNSLVIGKNELPLINVDIFYCYEVYVIGFTTPNFPSLDESVDISHYLNNITYPFKGIEGFTERSEIQLTKGSDDKYAISYLDNSLDFYYSIPATLNNPFDISKIAQSTYNFTIKILAKKKKSYFTIDIPTITSKPIFSESNIFNKDTNRNAMFMVGLEKGNFEFRPNVVTNRKDYLFNFIYYNSSQLNYLFSDETFTILSDTPVLVSLFNNNYMRGRINCTNKIVKYTGPAIFEGKEFQFTYSHDVSLSNSFITTETCSFKFIGTSLASLDREIKFFATTERVSITDNYPNPRSKQEVDLTVSITTIPTSTVSFSFKCPSSMTCSKTSFDLNSPNEFITINIATTDFGTMTSYLLFDITSTDRSYQISSFPHMISFNDVGNGYLIEPNSIKFNTFALKESSYTISTISYPRVDIEVTVDLSDCNSYFSVTPTSYTLSSNDFIGTFIITPKISSLTKDFKCIVSHKLETLDPYYSQISDKLIVGIYTYFEDLTPAPKLLYVSESEEEYSIILHFDRDCYADEGIITLYKNDTDCYDKFITMVFPPLTYHTCIWMDRKTLKIYYDNTDIIPSSPPKVVYLKENILHSIETSKIYSTGYSVITLRAVTPEIDRAVFDDEDTVTIKFDNIIYGVIDGELCSKIFNCSESFASSTCSLGVDNKSIIMHLSADSTIIGSSIITPLPNKIKGSINSMYYSQKIGFLLEPYDLPPAKAIVDYPTAITSCESLIIDGSKSIGSWRFVKYRWESMSVVNQSVYKYLDTNSAILTIPAGILKENITLIFTIYYDMEWHGDSVKMNIEVIDAPILQSSIEGSPTLTLKTDKEMYVKGYGSIVECGESVELFNILSKFSLFIIDNNNNKNEIEIKKFTTKDPSRLYFAPHSLPIGNYKIKFTVSMEGLNDSISEALLNVELGDFYFTVKGYPVISLPNTDKLTLAVEAQDLDIPDTVFEYKWNCSSDKGDNYCNELIKDMNESTIIFNENTLTPGVYKFTSTAYPDDDSNREMSVYIFVTITDGTMKVSFSIESLFSNSTVYKPSDVIGLKVKFDDNDNDNLKYSWVYMSDSSLNPLLSRNDSSLVYVSCEKMNTSLLTHTIRLYIYKGNISLYSDYVFTVIEPPKGGYIDSSSNEVSLGDSIVISSSNWEGAKDFTYRFGVLINGDFNYLQPVYSSSNEYNGILPLGDKQKDYILTLIVFVKDKYGAISNTTNGKDGKPLIIKCYPISSIEIIKNITKKLEDENNYDQIFNFANGVKNQITTDLANTTNCVNGNKSSNNSCNCFEGYTGILCDLHIPIDGGLSVNYTFSEPDRECGKITQYRWKTCDNPMPKYGGKECEIIKEKVTKIEPCEDSDNNIDGGWGNWSEWSECVVKCIVFNGNEVEGVKSRNRLCNNPQPYNEGKECEGNSIENGKCYKSCSAPNKLCHGEYINSNGKAAGSKCNERGKCIINREGCKEYEPNCHSTCECYEGYSGSSCQYTDEEFENNKEIKSSLISLINTAIENTVITPESVEQQSSTILNVIDPPIDLDEDALRLTYRIIDNTITKLKDDKPIVISYKSISDYIKSTSLLIQNEWDITAKEANKRNLEYNNNNNNEIEYTIGSKLINLYKNISQVHYNQQYSAPLHISTGSLGISLIKADLSFDPNATISTNQAEVDLGNIIDVNTTTEIAIFDFIDNPNKNDYIRTKRTSGLTSIILSNEKGDMNVNVRDFKKPIYYRQRLNDDTELKHIRCSFYNGEDLEYTGVVLVGVIKVENGSNYALCAMLHLTDFTVQKKSIFPKMNFVNPIGDAKLLGNYDSSNMLVPIILGSVLVLCIVFWIYTKCKDKDEDRIVSEEKARNFLLYGKFRPSRKEEEKKEKVKNDNNNSIKKPFFKYYAERLLDEHKFLAPGFQSMNELMEITRSQNVLCLTAIILTDTAVNALFFGLNPANIAQVVTTSIISALAMLPATMIIPFLFKFANTYKSHTLQSKSKNKKSKLKVLKNKIELIKNHIMNENSTLFKYHTFMLIESSIFIILELIFTIIALIVLPSGYITIIIVGLFVLYIIETFLIFAITTLKHLFYYLYMFVIVLFMLFNFAILVLYFIILSRNEKIVYNTWKFFYDISSTQELYCLYIEESLNCCGWNNINDYNVRDCTTINAYVSGNQNSCKDIYYDKFDQYSPFWIIYFIVGIIAFIPKLVVLVQYVLYQFNQFEKVMAEDRIINIKKEKSVNKEEETKRKTASEMIVRSCRKLLFKRHFIREREYIIWLRNRKIRAGMLIFANFIVCLYILIMIYINLLYGVKFESSQANKWIISSVISMIIDVILQQPSMILLKSVASTTLTSLL